MSRYGGSCASLRAWLEQDFEAHFSLRSLYSDPFVGDAHNLWEAAVCSSGRVGSPSIFIILSWAACFLQSMLLVGMKFQLWEGGPCPSCVFKTSVALYVLPLLEKFARSGTCLTLSRGGDLQIPWQTWCGSC